MKKTNTDLHNKIWQCITTYLQKELPDRHCNISIVLLYLIILTFSDDCFKAPWMPKIIFFQKHFLFKQAVCWIYLGLPIYPHYHIFKLLR